VAVWSISENNDKQVPESKFEFEVSTFSGNNQDCQKLCANTAGCYKLDFDTVDTTCALFGDDASGSFSDSTFALNGLDCIESTNLWTDYKVAVDVSVLFGTSATPADFLASLKQNNDFSWKTTTSVTDVPDLTYAFSILFEPVLTVDISGLTTPQAEQVWITFKGLIYFRESTVASRRRRATFSIDALIESQATAAANDVTDNLDAAGASVDEKLEPETSIQELEPIDDSTYENPCDSDDFSLQASAKCCPDHFGIAIHSCVFDKLNMDPSAALLTGPNAVSSFNPRALASNACAGRLIDNEYHFGEEGKITDCGNEIVSNDTHIVIKSSIQGVAGVQIGRITRQRRLEVDLECAFERVLQVSTGPNPIMTSLYHFVADLGEAIGSFDVSIAVFKDDAFSTHFASDEIISIPAPLFVKTTLVDAADNLKLQFNRCWATPSADPQDATSYIFLENFCGNEIEITGDTLEVFENGEESYASFRLTSFEFHDDSSVFLHCDVKICDSSSENCVPDCSSSGRKRRSTDQAYNTITAGPIRTASPLSNKT